MPVNEHPGERLGLEGATLRKLADPTILIKTPAPKFKPDLSEKDGGPGVNYEEEMSAVMESLRSKEKIDGSGLRLSDLDLNTGIALESITSLTDTARLLQQAEEKIQIEEFDAALELLDELLSLGPKKQEEHRGRYLKAFCHSNEGDLKAALEALRPLRKATLDSTLVTRVEILRAQIRSMMAPAVVMSFLMESESAPEIAREHLQEAIDLDPECAVYYFVLANSFGAAGRHREALAATESGLGSVAREEREPLKNLAEQIRRRLLVDEISGAVNAFKERQYGKSQALVDKLAIEWRKMEIVQDFSRYLGQLAKSKPTAQPKKPTGPPDRVDRLYFMIAREEIDSAKEFLQAGEIASAERVLVSALEFVPKFPFANFLYASSIFTSVGEWLGSPTDLDFDAQIKRLKTALAAAAIASTDSEIEDAPRLVKAIEIQSALVAGLRDEFEIRKAEAGLVNKAIEEFQSIMQSAENGIRDADHYDELLGRLNALRRAMPTSQVSSDEAKEALRGLSGAVDRNVAQLTSLESKIKEGRVVGSCYEKFNKIMAGVEKGIENELQLFGLSTELNSLKREVESARAQVSDKDGRKALKNLAEAVDKHLAGLAGAFEQVAVGQLVTRFNAVMEALNSPLASSDFSLRWDKQNELAAIERDATSARSNTKTRQARQTLDQLITAAATVRKQLG